jgi:3-oxoacyl-[acyl-carrier-protein] synthase III
MGLLQYENVKIAGISVCVPERVVDNIAFGQTLFTNEELHKTIESTGVNYRHVAPSCLCTSDLCYEAAKDLLGKLAVNPAEIEAIIFITQTPDYRLPATACTLQERLGLNKSTMAFDINLGCSGYIYGLNIGFGLLNQPSIKKVLLLVGDTITKCVSPFDRSSSILFGDAGSATLLEFCASDKKVYSSLNSDGSGAESLIIKGGGYRHQSSPDTLKIIEETDTIRRSLENLAMDGAEIFNFTIREIPKDIRAVLEFAGTSLESVDYFIFHQANKFIIDFLAKKLKIPGNKYPISLNDFGNTSSASIPLTISTIRSSLESGLKKVILSGFGVGLSWGTVLIELDNCEVLPIKYI